MADDDRSAILVDTCAIHHPRRRQKHLASLCVTSMRDKSTRSVGRARGCDENRRRAAISMLQRLSENNTRVQNAELRLMLQRSFIERLQAAQRDTASAEESLEVMRNLLGELYQERTALRRHLASQSRQSGAPGKSEALRRGAKAQKSLR